MYSMSYIRTFIQLLFARHSRENAIPYFPEFKAVDFTTKETFEKFVHKFETYSDFNFNSFFSWDTEGKHEVTQLNGNLVLKFTDYVNGEPFYSLIGTKKVGRTMRTLIDFSEKQNVVPKLKLIPEITVNAIKNNSDLFFEEDHQNHDYIFSITELSELKGRRFNSKRRASLKCKESNEVRITDESNNLEAIGPIIELMKKWEGTKRLHGKEVDMEQEFKAIQRILENLTLQESLTLTFARKGEELVGFSVDELLPNKFVLSHYFKTLPGTTGLSEYLNMYVAQNLKKLGYEFWNWEQDLGIESLQKMKLGYRPQSHQKKYTVTKVLYNNQQFTNNRKL